MKKIVIMSVVTLGVFFLAGCGQQKMSQTQPSAQTDISSIIEFQNLGSSMSPTIESGEMVLISKLTNDIKFGDIILFEFPGEGKLIKRVIGLPGDIIEIKDKAVFRNNNKLDEPYLDAEKYQNETYVKDGYLTKYEVPANEYFVLGDNRTHTTDSRTFKKLVNPNYKLVSEIKYAQAPYVDKAMIIGKYIGPSK